MEILDIKVTTGPNIWSVIHQKLIILKLIISKKENIKSDKLQKIIKKLLKLLSSLPNFNKETFLKLNKISNIEEMIMNIALYLQIYIGIQANFGLCSTLSNKILIILYLNMKKKMQDYMLLK